jgi:hypothetical protein
MALVASLALAPVSADASSWSGNPLAGLDKQTKGNISYHPDFNKHDVIGQKSYGWQVSKVCGLDLCVGKDNGDKQPSFLQGPVQQAPQTYGNYLGMSITGDSQLDRASEYITFNGKFFIKGFFK